VSLAHWSARPGIGWIRVAQLAPRQSLLAFRNTAPHKPLTSAKGVNSRSCITSSTYSNFSALEYCFPWRIKAENSRHSRTLKSLAYGLSERGGQTDSRCVTVMYIGLHAEAGPTAEGTVEGVAADRECPFDESSCLSLGNHVKQSCLSGTRL
jgi:hypothetical protein